MNLLYQIRPPRLLEMLKLSHPQLPTPPSTFSSSSKTTNAVGLYYSSSKSNKGIGSGSSSSGGGSDKKKNEYSTLKQLLEVSKYNRILKNEIYKYMFVTILYYYFT